MGHGFPGRRRFRLRKWYLDVVTPDGVAMIGYHAQLRWGLLRARYGAVLVSPGAGPGQEWTTLRPGGEPEPGPDGIAWGCPALQVEGMWRPTAAPAELCLLDGPGGAIHWRCVAPRAEVRVRLGPAIWEGTGYLECLEMTVLPWLLPFDTLHWGRYVSDRDAIVWILWDEGRAGAWCLHDGTACPEVALGDAGLELGGGVRLALDSPRTVRAAPVVSALAPLPRLLARMPERFLAAREEKWLSRARLGEQSSGWALHERVRLR